MLLKAGGRAALLAAAAALAAPHRAGAQPRRGDAGPIFVGPLVCGAADCPRDNGRPVNNSNFHLRDISIALAGDGYYYLTGTSTSAGDGYWTDVWDT
eukprot:gene828-4173_t